MSCSRKLLITTNTFAVVFGLLIIGLGVYLTFEQGENRFVLQFIPQVGIYSLFGSGGLVFLVGGIGLFGICARARCFMYCYILLTTLTFFITVLAGTYLLLHANDIETTEGLDNLVSDVELDVQRELISFAKDNKDDWLNTQQLLNCCGISLQALFFDYSKYNAQVSDVFNGPRCNDGKTDLDKIVNGFVLTAMNPKDGTVPEEAAAIAKNSTILNSGKFFCIDEIEASIVQFTIPIGSFIGFFAILQLLNIRAAYVVLYRIIRANGGFVGDYYGDDVDDYSPGVPDYARKQSKLGPLQSELYPSAPDGFNRGGDSNSGVFGRMSNRISATVRKGLNNDFFNPPAAPAGGIGQPRPMDDFRDFSNRVSSRIRHVSSGARSASSRVSARFRGGGSPFGRDPPPNI